MFYGYAKVYTAMISPVVSTTMTMSVVIVSRGTLL